MEPGDVTEDGGIVSASASGKSDLLIRGGQIWIALEKLADAERHGWRETGPRTHNGLTKVAR